MEGRALLHVVNLNSLFPTQQATNQSCCNTVLARLQSWERGVCVYLYIPIYIYIYAIMQYNTQTQTYYIKWKMAIKLHVLLGNP